MFLLVRDWCGLVIFGVSVLVDVSAVSGIITDGKRRKILGKEHLTKIIVC